MRALIIGLVAGALAASGCGNKEEKAREEAAKAQKEADDKSVEAAKAQREADDKAVAAKREADAAMTKTHDDARDKLRKDYDASDRKLASLREKVAKATGVKRKNANAALTEVETRVATVKGEMAGLSANAGTAWDTAKTQIEADQAALDKAIDNLETTLK